MGTLQFPLQPFSIQSVRFSLLLGLVLVVKSLLLQPGFLFCWVFFFYLPIQPLKTFWLLNFLAAWQQSFPSVVTSQVTQDALESTNSVSLDNTCCFFAPGASCIVKNAGAWRGCHCQPLPGSFQSSCTCI